MSSPASTIHICSGVRLSPTYDHTIFFSSIANQKAYFEGKVVKTFSSYTHLRKEWSIKVGATMRESSGWVYLFFTNPLRNSEYGLDLNPKTYYYFIRKIEYVNDSTVELFLEMDVMQTYFFDYKSGDTFIERIHPTSDNIGENTVDEGLELGEYITNNGTQQYLTNMTKLCVLIMSTVNPQFPNLEDGASVYNGVYAGCGVWAVAPEHITYIYGWLKNLDSLGKSDAIINMWMYPQDLVTLTGNVTWLGEPYCKPVLKAGSFEVSLPRASTINGYTPQNNKMFTYPFNFGYVNTFSGESAVYRFEKRYNTSLALNFHVTGAISPDAGAKIYPKYYKNQEDNWEEALTLPAFPSCSWNQDVYKLWLANNMNQHKFVVDSANMNMTLGTVGAVAGMIGSAVTGNVGGVLASAGAGIGNAISQQQKIEGLMAQKRDAAIQPSQAKGSYSASVNSAWAIHNFAIENRCITSEYARKIDRYFTVYGYKLNEIRHLNFPQGWEGKYDWCYVKTSGYNPQDQRMATSTLPAEARVKLSQIYDKGITFWKNGDQIGDYGLDS